MSSITSSIIPCPACKVKNRIAKFSLDKIPLCAKCGTRLVSKKENETNVWFGESLKNLSGIPNPKSFGKPLK